MFYRENYYINVIYFKFIRMRKKCVLLAFIGLAAISLTSCTSDNSSNGAGNPSSVGFYLTDAPAQKGFKSVNIDVQSISYSTDSTDWTTLPITPKVVEITQFANGKDSLLSNIVLKAGEKVTQIRLVLGSNNTITLSDGTVKTLIIPSGSTSGLKLNVQSVPTLTSGYKVLIDFDAARSIVSRGNGSYSLKPVIRSYIAANTSSIDGYLLPANQSMRVFTVTSSGDTISTVSDTLNYNHFRLSGLFSGTYKLQAENLGTGAFVTLKDGISVIGGTDIQLSSATKPLLIP